MRKKFSKIRSQNIVGKNPYFQSAPLIEKRTLLLLSLIPLLLANKGIRVNGIWEALLLRELSKNKGLMQKTNEYCITEKLENLWKIR